MNKNPSVDALPSNTSALLKLFFFSSIGIFMFFVPIELMGKSTIPVDHIVSWLHTNHPGVARTYTLFIIIAGALYPFTNGSWRENTTKIVFSLLKVLGIAAGLMAFFQTGPDLLLKKDMLPFLFDKLAIPVGLVIPLGAIFLTFLVSYGLLELVGVLFQPIMRPLFKTPGKSAIDAVASFVGSYSIGLLITNRVYKSGQYSAKEAAIIATGFSTVSATFMIIVAKTLGLMEIWNLFFWSTLIITFLTTAITVRLFPLCRMNNEKPVVERDDLEHPRLKQAMIEGINAAGEAPSLLVSLRRNIVEGLLMAMNVVPSILSVGLLGLLMAKYTPVFDWMGYLLYPFTFLAQLPEPLMVAKASATGLAEMFLPALLMVDATLVARFVTGCVSISGILFLSAAIPCILATDIPLTIRQMIIIWYQRVVIATLLSAPVAFYAERLVTG